MDDDGHGTIKRGGSGNNYSFRLVMKIYVTETETKTKTKTKKNEEKKKAAIFPILAAALVAVVVENEY